MVSIVEKIRQSEPRVGQLVQTTDLINFDRLHQQHEELQKHAHSMLFDTGLVDLMQQIHQELLIPVYAKHALLVDIQDKWYGKVSISDPTKFKDIEGFKEDQNNKGVLESHYKYPFGVVRLVWGKVFEVEGVHIKPSFFVDRFTREETILKRSLVDRLFDEPGWIVGSKVIEEEWSVSRINCSTMVVYADPIRNQLLFPSELKLSGYVPSKYSNDRVFCEDIPKQIRQAKGDMRILNQHEWAPGALVDMLATNYRLESRHIEFDIQTALIREIGSHIVKVEPHKPPRFDSSPPRDSRGY